MKTKEKVLGEILYRAWKAYRTGMLDLADFEDIKKYVWMEVGNVE